MTDETPVACSLEAGALKQRLKTIGEYDGDLVLSIAAPEHAQAVADGLAEAFSG